MPKPLDDLADIGSHIDFAFAFAPLHRITVARPEDSHQTLLDAACCSYLL